MNNYLPILKTFLLPFFFFFFHHKANALAKAPYAPSDVILINCGSSNETSGDGRQWNGDLDLISYGPIQSSHNTSLPVQALNINQDSSVDSVPYMTARASRSQFMYSFPVTPGNKFVRLYFYPASSYGQRFNKYNDFFDVIAGPFTLLTNFSASLYSDSTEDRAFIKEFCINVDENESLNLTFAPFSSHDSSDPFVFVNGIEIVSMPTNLYFTSPQTLGLIFIGIDRQFYVQNDTALETMCRLNVGGSFISGIHDTGMYRSWDNDSDYFYTKYGDNLKTDMSLNYSKIPPYTAPDDVYRSARSMGSYRPNTLRPNNLTWKVPVDQSFRYLVRLHFCEFVDRRRFAIFIDNQTAELDFDAFESSGGSGIPMYKEYVVKVAKKRNAESENSMLFITLQPNASTAYADAILNGLEVLKLSDSDRNLARPVNEGTVGQQSPTKKSNNKQILLIVIGVSVTCLLISFSLLGILVRQGRRRNRYGANSYGSLIVSYRWLRLCWGKQRSRRRKGSTTSGDQRCRHFSLDEILVATNNFHEDLIIGVGGFGNVYRGDIDDGAMVVAIKRLNPESRQGAHEFKTEIETLSPLQHAHLVSLIGYCDEGGEMILVYDYITNGTLREHLYETNNAPLTWIQRLEICVGAATGLHYLHAGMAHPIIHRDVKTTNILLDENWVAKVSDFGLSKMGINNNAVSTMVKGTWGYLDPEYARLQKLTEKSDVYSFGVVLLEVLCARRPLNQKLEEEEWNLAYWARKCIGNGTIHQIIDPYLMGKIAPKSFKIFVELAESCVCDNGTERPTMHDVMEKLKFALEVQEAADSEMVVAGNQTVYPATSFHSPRYTYKIGDEIELDSTTSTSGGLTTLDTNTTRTTFSLQSDSMSIGLL